MYLINPESDSNEWNKTILKVKSSVHEVIDCLNESSLQIVLIVNSDGTLVGTVTDGDIRRGLLNGISLDSEVESILNPNPIVASPELNQAALLQIMQSNHIGQLPLVDKQGRIIGLHMLSKLIKRNRANLMVIMAGGEGKRLRPHTENCPKPMLPIGEKPVLQHIIERANSEGFNHFVIVTHYLGHMISGYFEDGSSFGVHIDYLEESSPLGTAGALSLITPKPTLPMVVTNGDVLTDIHYGELLDFHCKHSAVATMAVSLHEWEHPFGVVSIDGLDIKGFEEKPVSRTHINAGIYILEPSVITNLKINEHCDMPTLFERLKDKGERAIVYPIHENWIDVGRAADLALARESNNTSDKE